MEATQPASSRPVLALPVAELPWLAPLNPAQAEAVAATEGPLLVLAGAGTGKTRVLVTRLAYILASRKAFPSQVLAVTFTNKAAREMQARTEALVGPIASGMWLGTFHAIAARILRRHAELVGLKSNFTILDTDDQIRLLKQILAAANIDTQQWPARALGGIIERWKDRGLTPDRAPPSEGGFAQGRAIELYRAYQARLKAANACDFGDLLLHDLEIFRSKPEVLEIYQNRFRYILVDEYQDSNVAQYLWLKLLARKHGNICCVGDDDQSIYGWRGAEVDNILRFEREFPGAAVVRLERNYRSTPHILGAASGLIAHNRGRLGKTLWTELQAGDKVQIRGVWDGEEEARAVGDEIEALQRNGMALNAIAILVRASHQTRSFEERFIKIGLKYRIVGGLRFYERQEIRDAVAYLRLVHQEYDDLAFERIVNLPKRGVGEATLQALHRHAAIAGVSLVQATRSVVESDDLPARARNALRAFLIDLDRWRGLAANLGHVELAALILEESGYLAMWQRDRAPDAPGRVENLTELIRALQEFENLGGFLEHVSLVMEFERDGGDDMLSVMTLHAAKGLEFEAVFLPGWEEGLFPNQRSLDEGGQSALEEERRLAHVGLTRAKRRCYIFFAANRRIYNQWQAALPSRFIEELPAENVEHVSEPAFYRPQDFSKGGFSDRGFGRSEYFDQSQESFSGVTLQGRAKALAAQSNAPGFAPSFVAGARVFHQKFGYGRVRAVEDNKLTIAFDKAGEKKVIASFVEPA
jgi:DNA helicase-2/ATP-dependent DNA helicase PcrA